MKNSLSIFWKWYERNYRFNVGVAAGLFAIQLVHLYWLSANVVAAEALGTSFFDPSPFWETLIALADYLEIPAIAATSVLYINEFRKSRSIKPLWFLFFINSQWLHIYWITDEVVLENLTGSARGTLLPVWLAWLAIVIDYLELPVIFDTMRRFITGKRE